MRISLASPNVISTLSAELETSARFGKPKRREFLRIGVIAEPQPHTAMAGSATPVKRYLDQAVSRLTPSRYE